MKDTFSPQHLEKHTIIMLICILGLFTDGYLLFISSFIDPFISHLFHPSVTQQGLFQAAAPIGAAIGALFFGRYCDRYGRKRMLLINLYLLLLSSILSSLAWNMSTLCVFRLFVGIAIGMDYPLCAAYLVEMAPKQQSTRYTAIAMMANSCAFAVGASMAWSIVSLYPHASAWRWILASSLIPLCALLALRTHAPESTAWLATQKQNTQNPNKNPYTQLLSTPFLKTTLALSGAWFFMDISSYSIALFTPFMVAELDVVHSGFVIANIKHNLGNVVFINSFFALGAITTLIVIQYVNNITLQKIGFFFGFIGLLLLSLSHTHHALSHQALMYAGFFIFNFFIGMGPDLTTYLLPAQSYPTHLRATGHGFCAGVAKIGAFLGILALPIMTTLWGIYITTFILSLTCLAGYALTGLIPAQEEAKRPLRTHHAIDSL